jgi:hypothetical protein
MTGAAVRMTPASPSVAGEPIPHDLPSDASNGAECTRAQPGHLHHECQYAN